jgi:hypothetical protein
MVLERGIGEGIGGLKENNYTSDAALTLNGANAPRDKTLSTIDS